MLVIGTSALVDLLVNFCFSWCFSKVLVAIFATIGVVLGAAYILWLYKRVIFGKLEKTELKRLKDLNFLFLFFLAILY